MRSVSGQVQACLAPSSHPGTTHRLRALLHIDWSSVTSLGQTPYWTVSLALTVHTTWSLATGLGGPLTAEGWDVGLWVPGPLPSSLELAAVTALFPQHLEASQTLSWRM